MLPILIKMLPLALLTAAGYLLCKLRLIDTAFTRQLSLVMLHYLYPALIISSMLRNFTWQKLLQHWMLPIGTGGIMLIGWLAGALALRWLRHHPLSRRRTFHLICTSNNYAFLPIIMVSSLWGEQAVAMVVFAGLGAEVCFWTLGITTLAPMQRFDKGALKQLLTMPMLALLAACTILGSGHLLAGHGITPPTDHWTSLLANTLLESCAMAGAATIPASAIICGAHIALLRPQGLLTPLMAGTSAMRLLIIPAACIAILLCFPMELEMRRVLFLIAIQPTAMANVTFAEAFGSDSEFAASAVLATHLLCMLTIPLWLTLLL